MPEKDIETLNFEGPENVKQQKTEIVLQTKNQIIEVINNAKDMKEVWGFVFEVMVHKELDERRKGTPETEEQISVRKLLESMYENADVILGKGPKKHAGKPDGIRLGFENNRLVIEEIFEIKSSIAAYDHGNESLQPRMTLETISDVVNVANLILGGKENNDIPPQSSKLSSNEINQRNAELNKIRNQLSKIKKKSSDDLEKIAFSENLAYTVILPNKEKLYGFDPHQIEKECQYAVIMKIESSIFSKAELYKIIETITEGISK